MTLPLATIEMPKEEAAARLEEYRGQLHSERTAQDGRIAAGYRALARGLPVIRLSESVQRGGFLPNGLPRIAVVRADATQCWVDVDWSGDVVYYRDDREPANRGALVNTNSVRVHAPRPAPAPPYPRWEWAGKTIVPTIPPRHRPNKNRLHRFHILWEVEEWTPMPPHDPALLRWIGGDLWAVMATWDLTEIERAVLGGA